MARLVGYPNYRLPRRAPTRSFSIVAQSGYRTSLTTLPGTRSTLKKLSFLEQRRVDAARERRYAKDVKRTRILRARGRPTQKKAGKPKPVIIRGPHTLSFSTDYQTSVRFLMRLKRAVLQDDPTRVYLDLSTIHSLSLAGALVLSAEIDRWSKSVGRRLRPRKTMGWETSVRRLLASIGFFELLGIQPPNIPHDKRQVTVLPIISSDELDREALQHMRERLAVAANVLDQDLTVYEALVEAADNARKHAYPADHTYEFPPIRKTWWATASWSPAHECVRLIVYDQGVGIPDTLPRWKGWEQVRERVNAVLGGEAANILKDASRLIQAAMEIDRTSLDGGHGKGLQDIVSVLDTCAGSSLRILSGRGSVIYDSMEKVTLEDHQLHIGGTLIEWTIPVGPKLRRVES